MRNLPKTLVTTVLYQPSLNYWKVTPLTANSPKPIASPTTINISKPISPNKTKVTRSARVSQKPNKYIGQS